MSLTIQPEAPPLRVDETGTIRVGKTRVLLDLVVAAFREGATAEEIAQMYDSLDLTDVYDVIAYYMRHRESVDSYLAQRANEAKELRKQVTAAQSRLPDIRTRLLARRAPKND
jgi:uncharacterized protein (DUF433 family)